MKKASKSVISFTLEAWARAMGHERRTLEVRLINTGYEWKPGTLIPFKAIYNAMLGDEQAEKNRNLKLDADRKEREEREANGELVKLAEVEQLITELVISPQRQELENMPSSLAKLCNPTDPAKAEVVLSSWKSRYFQTMQAKLR